MNSMRNVYAVILAALVLITTVVILLVIWDVIDLNAEVIKKTIWSLLTLFLSSGIVLFIFNNIYQPSIKPPKPPKDAFSASEKAAADTSS